MKNFSTFVFLLTAIFISPSSFQKSAPETPGKIELEKHPIEVEPPLGPQPQQLDLAKIRAEAEELSTLAQIIPVDVAQIAQGKLPKDMAEKLKRIEKLSKHLRNQITP